MYGVEVYGRYSMIYNLLCIIAMFCYAWLGQSFIRLYIYKSEIMLAVCLHLLKKSLFVGAIVFILLCKIFLNITYFETFCFVPCFFIFGYYCFFLLVNQAKQNPLLMMVCEFFRTATNLLALILVGKMTGTTLSNYTLALALFISYLGPTFLMYYKHALKSRTLTFTNSEFVSAKKNITQYGIPIAIFLSASLALSVNDRYLIRYFINATEAGAYSAIYDTINKAITALFSPLLMTFYPVIAAKYNNGEKAYAFKKLKQIIIIECLIIIIGFICFFFLSNSILKLLFSKLNNKYTLTSTLIFLGVSVWQICMLIHKPLELLKSTKYIALAALLSLIFNIVINIVLLQVYKNVIVCAISTIATSFLYSLLVYFFYKLIQRKVY
jgi:O-antigen/teichoic acid export membrane protein